MIKSYEIILGMKNLVYGLKMKISGGMIKKMSCKIFYINPYL